MMVLIFTLSASSAFKAVPMRALGEEVKRQQELGQSRMVKMGRWEKEEVKNGTGSEVKLQMNTEVLVLLYYNPITKPGEESTLSEKFTPVPFLCGIDQTGTNQSSGCL